MEISNCWFGKIASSNDTEFKDWLKKITSSNNNEIGLNNDQICGWLRSSNDSEIKDLCAKLDSSNDNEIKNLLEKIANNEIAKQFLNADKVMKPLPISKHPDEMYTSKCINTKLISKEIKAQADSVQINLDITEI
ncbi:hypothetical protein F8M41_001143 [Gigaspora margarita]|uniref:Uncharacterized protein n=1 Tax=Gigaspora margarita TaxID=4874 RepID=A0A8H3XGE5_GIGMA|nr:hypothetical protein F8M41_001143 [Gigaspora margarita]